MGHKFGSFVPFKVLKEKKKLPIKNIQLGKVDIQNWRRDEKFSRQAKGNWVYYYLWAGLKGNFKGTSLSCKERALISSRKTYESVNLTCKGKYLVKIRMI